MKIALALITFLLSTSAHADFTIQVNPPEAGDVLFTDIVCLDNTRDHSGTSWREQIELLQLQRDGEKLKKAPGCHVGQFEVRIEKIIMPEISVHDMRLSVVQGTLLNKKNLPPLFSAAGVYVYAFVQPTEHPRSHRT